VGSHFGFTIDPTQFQLDSVSRKSLGTQKLVIFWGANFSLDKDNLFLFIVGLSGER